MLAVCCAGLLLNPLHADSTFAALAAKANEARDSDRQDEAIALYKKALALQTSWAEGWWYLGTLLYGQDRYADAANAFQQAVTLSPKSGVAFVMLGLCEAKLGRDRDALQHLVVGRNLGIGDNPDLRPVMLYTQGTLLLGAGEFGQAQDIFDALVRDGAEQEELIVSLGQAVLGIPAETTSAEVVRRAGWAEHFAARREIQDALREYTALAAEFPKVHNVQFAYGRFLLANHLDEKAVEAFQREIENTPNHLLARLGIAGIKLNSDPASGVPYAEQAVKLAPKLAEAHYLLGALLLDAGHPKPAIEELETAGKLKPDEAKTYFALSRAYGYVHRDADAARARAAFAHLNAAEK